MKQMSEEELEYWHSVQYRMEDEGFDYCFEHYSHWDEIKDEEFHRLRLGFLQYMKELRQYINDKVEEGEQNDNEITKEYWGSDLPYPLSPSEKDLKIYADYMNPGKTLMLGCTKLLLPLSDVQMDIDPWYDGDTVIKQDWVTNEIFYDNIILDGGLCFTKELCDDVLEMASKHCNKFITRSFNRKLDTMRIADYFPQFDDFEIRPTEARIFDDYSFFIWEF
jgi:hypothetical protein